MGSGEAREIAGNFPIARKSSVVKKTKLDGGTAICCCGVMKERRRWLPLLTDLKRGGKISNIKGWAWTCGSGVEREDASEW